MSPKSRPVLRSLALLGLFGCIAFYFVFNVVARYDIRDMQTRSMRDIAHYIALSQGADPATINKPFRYRLAVPWLAARMPEPPGFLKGPYRVDPERTLKWKFGLVNFIAITLGAMGVFWLAELLGFSPTESLVGALLYLAAFYISVWGAVPMIDASSYAFLALGTALILRGRLWELLALTLVGSLFRETVVMLAPIALMVAPTPRLRWQMVAAVVVGLLPYLYLRLVAYPDPLPGDYTYGISQIIEAVQRNFASPRQIMIMLFELFFAFGAMLVLAPIGLARARREGHEKLVRLAWLIPIVFVIPLLLDVNLGRIWFFAFPAMIPLSLLALRGLLQGEADPAEPA